MKSKLFPESALAHELLDGLRGIEIGEAAHNAFGLNTINVDKFGEDDPRGQVYRDAQIALCGTAAAVDVVASGDDLPFADQSYDFVIASHVIEHFYNPIAALREWCRVAKEFVFLIVPNRDALDTDRDKPLTHLAEMQARQLQPSHESDEHHSRWTVESFQEMCAAFNFNVVRTLATDDKVGNGFIVVIRVNRDADTSTAPLAADVPANKVPVGDGPVAPQSWETTQGTGVTRINCKALLPNAPLELQPEVAGERFGVAYAVNLIGGTLFRFRIDLVIPAGMTCLFEVCGYSTKYQRAFAVIDSAGNCVDLGEEITLNGVNKIEAGHLSVEMKFHSPQSATDWAYIFFNGAGTEPPKVLGFYAQALDVASGYRAYEPARQYAHTTWFAVQAALVFRNYFHFEFELHRTDAALVGVELRAPVAVTGVRWMSGAHVQHDGQGLVPERTGGSQMRSPAMMERFGSQQSYAGHQLYGLFSDFFDCQYMSIADSDKHVNFGLIARFDDGMTIELPLLPVDPNSDGILSPLKAQLNERGGGKFVEVGGLGPHSENIRALLSDGWHYTAVDINGGANVDIVGDAHHLASLLPLQSVDVIYSADVMEHMLAPWKFVLEANKVLKLGGIFLALIPSAWPLHAEPWDYWRMTEHAWPAILNAGTGFEIIETGVQGSCAVVPYLPHDKQSVRMQSAKTHLHTFVIARKVSEPTATWTAYDINLTRGKYLRNI